MGEHSKGPWIETGISDWFPDRYEGEGSTEWTVIHSDADGTDVAIVMSAPAFKGSKALDANARLIAASPTLLEACERLVASYNGMETGEGEPCPDVAFARAAIALATGKDL